MELEKTALFEEVQAIATGPSKPVHFSYHAVIHVVGLGLDVDRLKVVEIDITDNYVLNYGSEIMLTVMVPGGTFAYDIYPNQSNLDVTLIKRPISEGSDDVDTSKAVSVVRYTATMVDKGSPAFQGNGMNTPSRQTLDLANLVPVTFQLFDKLLEQLRMKEIGAIPRNATVEQAIKVLLTNESRKVTVGANRQLKGVDMVPAHNTTPRAHILIPQRVKLVDLPNYIHHKCGGVYNTGMAYFLQNDYWYVFPPFDTTRFTKSTRTLTIVVVPKDRMPGIERTYRKDGDSLVVLATGDIQLRDDTDANQLSDGNGVRFADAEKMMEDFTRNVGNKTMMSRANLNNEFVTTKRPNGMNNVMVSDKPITANPYVEYSKLAERQGGQVGLVWENSNPDLLEPGMNVKILHVSNGEIKRVYGVLQMTHTFIGMKGNGWTSTRHKTQTALSVFVNSRDQ